MKAFILLSLLAFGCNSNKTTNTQNDSDPIVQGSAIDEEGLSKNSAILRTIHGVIKIKFYPEKAPVTVKRITELIGQGFYDGIVFHRVIDNFVVQGGDPTGTGQGGSGKKLPAEFNDLKHEKGTVAMARTQDPNSADSQFYMCLSRLEHLDGKYTIFGQVVEGLDVLDKIKQGDKIVSFTLKD